MTPSHPGTMRAMWRSRYGGPEALEVRRLPVPTPGPGDLLVRVHAASLNRSDWEYLRGSPFYARMQSPFRPSMKILGTDLAGEVVAVGSGADDFKVGDRVFADTMYHGAGAFAEYALVRKGAPVALIPETVGFSQASALPQAGTIALQGLASVRPQDRVLLIGAAGATGIFAVQLAKAAGAMVTAVDSGAKLELMRKLGADRVVDYTRSDVAALGEQFDLILDPIADLNPRAARRLLADGGTYLIVGGSTHRLLGTLLAGAVPRNGSRQLKVLLVKPASEPLKELAEMLQTGQLKVPIEAEYGLPDLPVAMRSIGSGLAIGRLVIRP